MNLGFGDISCLAGLVEASVVEGGRLGQHSYLCQYETERQRHNLATMLGTQTRLRAEYFQCFARYFYILQHILCRYRLPAAALLHGLGPGGGGPVPGARGYRGRHAAQEADHAARQLAVTRHRGGNNTDQSEP